MKGKCLHASLKRRGYSGKMKQESKRVFVMGDIHGAYYGKLMFMESKEANRPK